MKDVVVIDSGGANLASLQFALARLDARANISRDAAEIAAAPRVILPGVGSARDAMARLEGAGLVPCIRSLRQPVLGICLGMQLLFEASEEGPARGLGVLAGEVRRLAPHPGLPVPHMGWNVLHARRENPLLEGLGREPYMYFVHGFAADASQPPIDAATCATTDYGIDIAAVVCRRNFWGTQFHPERSGTNGARLLANFLELD